MNGIDKLIAHISQQADMECAEIAQQAADECRRIKAEYSRVEQEEYWKFIDAGSKETERRMRKLQALAQAEADKQIDATQREMVDEAFKLAAKKLRELRDSGRPGPLTGSRKSSAETADEFVAKYRNLLAPGVTSILFD